MNEDKSEMFIFFSLLAVMIAVVSWAFTHQTHYKVVWIDPAGREHTYITNSVQWHIINDNVEFITLDGQHVSLTGNVRVVELPQN